MASRAQPFSRSILAHQSATVARAVPILALLALAGCMGDRSDVTGSIAPASLRTPSEARAAASTWASRYQRDPGDKQAALNYARALKANTQYQQAEAVLETAAIKAPFDSEILGAYGKALADTGKFREAADVLARAQKPDDPSWSILSAQGSVADQMGNHVDAQNFYATALKIRPDDPGVLTNLGLSYALSNKLALAEATIRRAAQMPGADMRVRQNLALVLALEGKSGEAEQVAQSDLTPAEAATNVAQIRGMIASTDAWRTVQRSASRSTGNPAPRRLQTALQTE